MFKLALLAPVLIASCAYDTESLSDELTVRRGVDYSWARPSPSGLVGAGYTFAVRYVSPDTTGKNLTAGEAAGLRAAGVDIVVIWENGASDALGGQIAGANDARAALAQATAVGLPAGRPIYFAIDFDASEAQQPVINAYFDGAASILGASRVGAYGGYWPISRLFNAQKIRWGWQTFAWSGGLWDARAQLRQTQVNVPIAGGACDIDEAQATDFGQFGGGGGGGGANGAGVPAGQCTATEAFNARIGSVNYWTCQGSARYVCDERGAKVVEMCPSGCSSAGVGADDQCNGGGGPICSAADIVNQTGSGAATPSIWTCQGGGRYVCDDHGFKITESCGNACQSAGFDHDDLCR